jgi:hypothetical protein
MAIFSVAPYELAFKAALLLPIPIWFLVAYQQFRLIRPYLRRSYLWLFATFVGGNLGVFAGGLTQLQTLAALEYHAYQRLAVSDYGTMISSDWIFAVAPALSLTVGCLATATVLGFLQSFCFGKSLSAALRWFPASVVSATVAGLGGYGSYWGYLWSMFKVYPFALPFDAILADLLLSTVGLTAGMIVYGLLTGAVLRGLLIRRAQPRKEALIAQFD